MVHKHVAVPPEIQTPSELYKFFHQAYSAYTKEQLLELMRESMSADQFSHMSRRELAHLLEIYCHGMVAGFFVCNECPPTHG